ncbi:MAG: toxin co-regulated pilus biosynthesis Q family protein [Alphaproteobacteria bacterium]|nr:toxin co-regulated pilus biosynthesis Q family protein [Alphaproteobacteria bacterium]
MFRKFFIAALFATVAGYCFASDDRTPQSVTSQIFYKQVSDVAEQQDVVVQDNTFVAENTIRDVPAWPLTGSDADVAVSCNDGACAKGKDNIRIVSKIGADLVVENNFNLGTGHGFGGWSGGANMLHGNQTPAGFDNECDGSEMPLLHREILEDDGGNVLTVSRSGRKNCGVSARGGDEYAAFAAKVGMTKTITNANGEIVDEQSAKDGITDVEKEIAVDLSADAEPAVNLTDQVRSWVVANGQTLRQVLQNWCDKEGWDLVWTTSREYPIEASAVFKGRFVDVASALVRNFGRATPVPYAKFYKGNRVLVISTTEE